MKFYMQALSTIAAAALLAILAATASASRLEISSQTLRVAFSSVRFREPFGSTADCAVTLEGSFHSRTIQKVAGTLSGYVTRAALGVCASGTTTILTETLPWHVRYLSFTGTLPNITHLLINIIGASFRTRFANGTSCLVRTTAEEPAIGTASRDLSTGELPTIELGGSIRTSCLGVAGAFTSSRDTPTVLNSTTRITVTLI